MAATQKSRSAQTIDRERVMSLAEILQALNEGKLKIVKIKYSKNRGYYASMGIEFPKEYDVLEARPGLVIYKIGGNRKAWTPGRGVYYKVPSIARPREGYAIAEIRGVIVYLHLS